MKNIKKVKYKKWQDLKDKIIILNMNLLIIIKCILNKKYINIYKV